MTRIYEADQFIGALGVEAYRVGGSVRDEIMDRHPKDADYVVKGLSMGDLGVRLTQKGAKISAIKARNQVHIGWRAAVKGLGLMEIVLPRAETNAGSGRDQTIVVDPDLSLQKDSLRRDFTFNALYKRIDPDPSGPGLVLDPTGSGLYDLQHRLIRTTHEDSFRDDPLRTLRALRFVSTLNADLAPETILQMARYADRVDGWMQGGVSGTVLDELKRLLMGQCPSKALRIARDTGVLAVALPELAPMLNFDQGSRYHDLTTDEHVFRALETAAHVDAPLRVRMALLFHDAGKPETAWVGKDGRTHYYEPSDKQWMEHERARSDVYVPMRPKPVDHEIVSARLWDEAAKRLNVDKSLRDSVRALVLHHMVPTKTKNLPTRVRRMRVQFGDDLLRDLLMHRSCDLSGKGIKVALNHIQHVARMEEIRAESQAAGIPASIKDLQVNGEDAKSLGLVGPAIGRALARVLDEVVCDPAGQKLTRDWQLMRLEAVR